MNGTKVELKSLGWLTQVWQDDKRAPKIKIELWTVRLLLEVKVAPKVLIEAILSFDGHRLEHLRLLFALEAPFF